ncbi:helix-turn-helix domain-containing protein [Halorientalis halophila]|uniref:helix-turn-helix domain-containing protein n=1 Tax=Halorientalis halophila TaxID=3108499 RepID=UPI00300A8545
MRYLTVLVRPTEGDAFHPLGQRLTADPSIRREAIHHAELRPDGTVLLLAEASGDRERYEEISESSPYVLEEHATGRDRWLAISQFEPNEAIRRILTMQSEAEVVVDTPIRFTDDGTARVTYLGTERALTALFQKTVDAEGFTVEVTETGTYEPTDDAFANVLTDRQQDVLEAAIDVGYYSVPREATHEDVAETVGIAPTTAGDHLRKIESRVLGTRTE